MNSIDYKDSKGEMALIEMDFKLDLADHNFFLHPSFVLSVSPVTMFCLVKALGRIQPRGQCQKTHHIGDFKAKIQPKNEGSSTTDRFERWIAAHRQRYQHAMMMFKYQNVNVNDLPKSVDWKDKGAVTPIKSQGTCGSCWVFVALATVEGAFKISMGRLVSLSTQQLIDCDRMSHGCCGGNMINAFKYIIRNGGVTSKDYYPYTRTHGCCQEWKTRAPIAYISDYQRVPANEEALLKAVAHQPVSTAIFCDEVDFGYYRGGLFYDHHEGYPNYVVTIVGYRIERNGINYWLIKNLWGKNWGAKGYIKMARDIGLHYGVSGFARCAAFPIV